MTRIEKHQGVSGELKKMKGEMVKEVRKGPRRRSPKLGCSLLFFAFIAAVISWVAWIVAGTGFVYVPVFTSVAFEQPVPERQVEAGVVFEQAVQEQFQTALTQSLHEGGGTLAIETISIRVTEESLTASVREVLQDSGVGFVLADEAQVSVHEEGLRAHVPIQGDGQETAAELLVRIDTQDGNLVIRIESVELGSVQIPTVLVSSLLGSIMDSYVNELSRAMSSYASINQVAYQEGWVEIQGTFNVEVVE